jgi:hypothetical protein
MRTAFVESTLLWAALVACGAHDKDVVSAKMATYDGPFEKVFEEVRTVVVARYGTLEVRPTQRSIATAWHQVKHAAPDFAEGTPAVHGRLRPRDRYFARFDIELYGGPPWRVHVIGHAASWPPGAALPVPFPDADPPAWLETETDALVLRIDRRLSACCSTTRD